MYIVGEVVVKDVTIHDGVVQMMEDGVDELVGAIFEEMTEIKNEAQDLVPKHTGFLEGTADTVGVNIIRSGGGGSVVIGFGTDYALVQHQTPPPGEGQLDAEGNEGLTYRHAPGRTWKYLETPVLQAAEGMERRLAERVRKRLAG
jgi:hypothetical protein